MRIVGILLAAGRGTRFGGDKLLAPLDEARSRGLPTKAMGVVAAEHLVTALPEAIAVIRRGDMRLAQSLRDAGLRIVECERADDGMGASLACGVLATGDADAWVVALADMPWIAPATIGAVVDALTNGADIVAPSYRGTRGHPVGFTRRHYVSLVALTGDAGARALIERSRERVTLIDVDDPGATHDIDTRFDLRRPG
ncbi:MAG TPA: nucleotidyltransferase family protein [Casimicrobiaceae bacterium]|nr:nucleotidyltransferase family protein [Casimicrobiaceae bacterium]